MQEFQGLFCKEVTKLICLPKMLNFDFALVHSWKISNRDILRAMWLIQMNLLKSKKKKMTWHAWYIGSPTSPLQILIMKHAA